MRPQAVAVHAAAHVLSGSPPQPNVKYQIDLSTDGGQNCKPLVKDWSIPRRGEEPDDFWSQRFCWGSAELAGRASRVRVRFSNSGGRAYARCEVHLVYRTAGTDATKVTFAWTDAGGRHQAAHEFDGSTGAQAPAVWKVPTGRNVRTRWVELTPSAAR